MLSGMEVSVTGEQPCLLIQHDGALKKQTHRLVALVELWHDYVTLESEATCRSALECRFRGDEQLLFQNTKFFWH